ncbi:MAG: hypothetical protein Q9160_000149 [Pyrenula sp. 1 TL-2023]
MALAHRYPLFQAGHSKSASSKTALSELEMDFRIINAILTTDRPHMLMPESCEFPENPGSDSDLSYRESDFAFRACERQKEDAAVNKILRRTARSRRDLLEDLEMFTAALTQTTEHGERSLPYLAKLAFEEFVIWRNGTLQDRIQTARRRWRDGNPNAHVHEDVTRLAEINGFCEVLRAYSATLQKIRCLYGSVDMANRAEIDEFQALYPTTNLSQATTSHRASRDESKASFPTASELKDLLATLETSRRNVEDVEDMLENFREALLDRLESSNPNSDNFVPYDDPNHYIVALQRLTQAVRRWTALLTYCESMATIDDGIYTSSVTLAAMKDTRVVANHGLAVNNRAMNKASNKVYDKFVKQARTDPFGAMTAQRGACNVEYIKLREKDKAFAKREDEGQRVEQEMEGLREKVKEWEEERREAVEKLHAGLEVIAKDDVEEDTSQAGKEKRSYFEQLLAKVMAGC